MKNSSSHILSSIKFNKTEPKSVRSSENANTASESNNFQTLMADVKPVIQDKVHIPKQKINKASSKARALEKNAKAGQIAAFYFSDEYEPHITSASSLSYVREDAPSYLPKLLRRGECRPELILDLHGYTKDQAKYDLADLILTCKNEQIFCANVIHGISGGVLKQKVPHYLMQHPDVLAFHQAPLEWGGQGALLVIIDIGEDLEFLLTQR